MATKEIKIKENGKSITIRVCTPTHEDLEDADRVYATTIASLVRATGKNKLLLRSELEKFLQVNSIWTDQDESQVIKLQTNVEEGLATLRQGGIKLSEGRKLSIEISQYRASIIEIMAKRRIFDETTIEASAENERNEYMVYSCTHNSETGDRYWLSFEDMKNDRASNAYQKAGSVVIENIYGVSSNFEAELPENKWLTKYGFIDSEFRFVDRKSGKYVNLDGDILNKTDKEVTDEIVANISGDIVEESPFIDDETNKPVVLKTVKKVTKTTKPRAKKSVVTTSKKE